MRADEVERTLKLYKTLQPAISRKFAELEYFRAKYHKQHFKEKKKGNEVQGENAYSHGIETLEKEIIALIDIKYKTEKWVRSLRNPEHIAVVEFLYFDELTYKEVAFKMNRSIETIRRRKLEAISDLCYLKLV